ncbi:glycosyltransferase family 2 protein [Acinetobacter towneri]|uniref:glycosyltransferase family 2 protein n=1 Tax=Acinetobacter towneri TaxID=202956 RepID=UPI00188CA009|nr:glycosyltransferase family 2 protein [Acinetobacter towneri]MBF4520270.1 glycosyltransferase family 2 protein [Acinetobacter towneri]
MVPLVSVIMPAYNAEELISESIESVLSQTYTNFELIVIDDCSKDQTVKVVERFTLKDSRVKLVKNIKNKGVAETRNAGLDQAKGSIVAFLDSDDKWEENKLEKQLAIFDKNPDIDMVYSAYYRFNNVGIKNIVKAPFFLNKNKLLKGNPIGNLTAIYNFKKHTNIRQKKIGHEDYLFWLEIFSSSDKVKGIGIQEPLAYYRVAEDGQSISGNKFKAAGWTWRIYREYLQLNIISSLYYFSYYMIKALLKRV